MFFWKDPRVCFRSTVVVKLIAAHVTGGNVEIFQPFEVTDTHVIIKVQHLSLFGLLMQCLDRGNPITAQVLLFYDQSLTKLNIHVLPENVPVEEVQRKHEGTIFTASFSCELTPGKKYRPCCKIGDYDYIHQPEEEKFKRDYSTNYHPTFEVFLNPEANTFSFLEENGQVV